MTQALKSCGQAKSTKAQAKQNRFQYSATYLAICGAMLALVGQDVLAYQTLGRNDQYNWRYDADLDSYLVTVDAAAADAARSNINRDYRSILILEGYGDRTLFVDANNETANYSLRGGYANYANSSGRIGNDLASGLYNYGPGLFQVIAAGSDSRPDPGQIEFAIPAPADYPASIWLDAYGWESGYIYLDQNEQGQFGFGYVPGVITAVSGGIGQAQNYPSYDRDAWGRGGDVLVYAGAFQYQHSPQINMNGRVGYFQNTLVPDVMSTSLPWTSAGAVISATSAGGGGGSYYLGMFGFGDAYVSAGDGGDVEVLLDAEGLLRHEPLLHINIGSHTGLQASERAPFVGVSAVSKGGGFMYTSLLTDENSSENDDTDAFITDGMGVGNGGRVTVTLNQTQIQSDTASGQTSYVIGVVAASVGGSAQSYPKDTKHSNLGIAPGVGGDVSVEITNASRIILPSNNSIGVIATSTGDQTILAPGTQKMIPVYKDTSSVGSVTVTIHSSSVISVGDKDFDQSRAKAGDTNIGILANASSNWARELFTGKMLAHHVPGYAGDVHVDNDGSVTAYGQNAVGVLAQSISGVSISSPGAAPVGNPESLDVTDVTAYGRKFPNEPGGLVDYESGGGSVTAIGDGATGLLLQSIGGGGGAGGDATGLFVAVGGQGARGGDGGSLEVWLNKASVTAAGDHARGVIGHTIGGGGGNGGHAKAYGTFFDAAIGGKAGSGGDGGNATFRADNSTITTTGQHAYGLVLQSIGGGGGTGGAAHNTDVGLGITVNVGVGGSGGAGGAGGALSVNIDDGSSIVTTGLDAHGVLLQSISGGGGAGGAASGSTYNIGSSAARAAHQAQLARSMCSTMVLLPPPGRALMVWFCSPLAVVVGMVPIRRQGRILTVTSEPIRRSRSRHQCLWVALVARPVQAARFR